MALSPERRSAVVTSDGFLDPSTLGEMGYNEKYGAATLPGHMVVPVAGNNDVAIAREMDRRGQLDVFGKSGHSRIHLQVVRRSGEDVQFDHDGMQVVVPVEMMSLRAVHMRQGEVKDELLRVLRNIVTERKRQVNVGRLALARPEDALSREQILEGISRHRLLLPNGLHPEEAVSEGENGNGVIELPLADLRHLLCEANFDENRMRNAIRFGKHALDGLQEAVPGLPPKLDGRGAFVGGIHLSLGAYTAIIDEQTNDPEVIHLAARILDGIRTSGIDVVRQVELFNLRLQSVLLEDLRIRVRLYHAGAEAQGIGARVVNERTIRHGVAFRDVMELHEQPQRLIDLMKHVGRTPDEHAPYANLLGGRSMSVDWRETSGFQRENLVQSCQKFAAADPKYVLSGKAIPYFAREVSGLLTHVAGEEDYDHSKLLTVWGLPDPQTLSQVNKAGVKVVAFHDVRTHADAHGMAPHKPNGRNNDVYFDGQLFAAVQDLYQQGMRFHLVRHETEDTFRPGHRLPAEVLEWDRRGLWLRPSAKERFDKVDTVIAMYGSHVEGMEEVLRAQLTDFSLRLSEEFGESLGYIHGKGPGVMYIADDVARNVRELAKGTPFEGKITADIMSIGVGISVEKRGQKPNFNPSAQVDFDAKDRLIRQKHMNDRATVNIFNIGGAGTLEEVAVTLCSQKLLKNIPAPMILVDPKGLSQDGGNLWQKLDALVDDLAAKKEISREGAANGKATVQLLQGYMGNFLHVVDSYDEAADIILRFKHDPVAYYIHEAKMPRKDLADAFEESALTFKETGMKPPAWLGKEQILSDPRWEATA